MEKHSQNTVPEEPEEPDEESEEEEDDLLGTPLG